MALVFDLVVSGNTDKYVANNASRALINRLTVNFTSQVLQGTNRFDLYQIFVNLFFTTEGCQNRLLEGIQSENLTKLRSGLLPILCLGLGIL